MTKKTPACGNPKCGCSTGIHGGLTYGSGRLDDYGYWDKPCRTCAAASDEKQPADLEEFIQKYMDEDKLTREEARQYITKNHTWLVMYAWPYADDLSQ